MKTLTLKKTLSSTKIIIVVLVAIFSILPFDAARAAAGDRIMDDAVFDNSGAMSSAAIDGFLNSFPNSCISPNRGFSAPDPIGYSPATSYVYGGNTTAGNVIAHAAQAYDINPQVLLATLQKEQSLVSGDAGCSTLRYAAAMGYGCPDSGTTHDYSGVNLYTINGSNVTAVNGTCVNTSSKAGFSQQVIRGAWLLKFAEQRSKGNVGWAIIRGSWNNSDDPQSCYSGPMTQGYWQVCPSGATTYYDGYKTIDGSATYILNGSTAALFWYTPHYSGNLHYYNIFTSWFGNTLSTQISDYTRASWHSCNIQVYDSSHVGRLYNPSTSDYFYTTNHAEACTAIKYGYIWDGIVMQNIVSTTPGAIPVYRLTNPARHLFTTSVDVKNQYLSSGYRDDGIAFYGYSSAAPGTIAAYCLTKGTTVAYTSAGFERDYFDQYEGFDDAGIAFYTPATSTVKEVYRLSHGAHRLYTTSTIERDAAKNSYGFNQESNSFSGDTAPTSENLPVYRISTGSRHFYTTNKGERDYAVMYYGYMSEGIEFYSLRSTASGARPVHRITDKYGMRVFTSSDVERDNAIAWFGYTSEGINFYGY